LGKKQDGLLLAGPWGFFSPGDVPPGEKLTGFFNNYHDMIDTVYKTDDSNRMNNQGN
jgi:hypothetical protein